MNDLAPLPIQSPIGGAPIYFRNETDTTMEDARALPLADAPDGTVVLTAFQRAGRGRRAGRVWHSAHGESLMFTLLRREVLHPQVQSLRMAAAVAEVLARRWEIPACIKWPNDVLVDGRKICGVLADYADGVLAIGCGLNLLQQSFPPELEASATSVFLSCTHRPIMPEGPLEHALAALAVSLLEHYVDLATRWHDVLTERLYGHGSQAQVRKPDGRIIRGTLSGVAPDGALLLESEKLYRLAAGEVSLDQR